MTVAFSTSSPETSLAIFDDEGECLLARRVHAPQSATPTLLELLREAERGGIEWKTARLYAADIGPGSFTGVRVGVAAAKTLAWACGGRCMGATAFDLVAPDRPVALPNRRHDWFLRIPGRDPEVVTEKPTEAVLDDVPDAVRFGPLLAGLVAVDPLNFNPVYLVAPSISQPKTPYREAGS